MPTKKLHFQQQKPPKSGTKHNYPEHFRKCILTFMKQSRLPVYRKVTGQSYIVKCLLIPQSWEHCLLITHSNHFMRELRSSKFMQVSSFSTTVIKKQNTSHGMLSLTIGNISFFGWRWFCRCMINRLSHAFPQTNVFTMTPWFWKTIWLAALRMLCSLRLTSEKLLLLHVVHACAEHFWQQICIFPSFVQMQRIQKWLPKFRYERLQLL